ncbi:LRR receptor-like serine/threonine-protein kinase FLS2 [Hordeum vulgare]|nr:LRR receptor-like serine/threonine-protein kinase FLS2 [Hordeum vulgare]
MEAGGGGSLGGCAAVSGGSGAAWVSAGNSGREIGAEGRARSISKKTGHVVKHDLGGYSLKGKTSLSLATLTRLVHLNLSDSDFDGVPIPEFVGSFKMLRYLDLSHAGFGGAAPPQIGNLSRLVYLDLGSFEGPGITADNFHWVSKLTFVRYLDLG